MHTQEAKGIYPIKKIIILPILNLTWFSDLVSIDWKGDRITNRKDIVFLQQVYVIMILEFIIYGHLLR